MEFSEQQLNNILILSLTGDICSKEIKSINDKILPFTQQSALKGVILDLMKVNAIDPSGIALIIKLYKTFKTKDKKLIFSSLSAQNRDIFSITKLDQVLPLVENTADAFKALYPH